MHLNRVLVGSPMLPLLTCISCAALDQSTGAISADDTPYDQRGKELEQQRNSEHTSSSGIGRCQQLLLVTLSFISKQTSATVGLFCCRIAAVSLTARMLATVVFSCCFCCCWCWATSCKTLTSAPSTSVRATAKPSLIWGGPNQLHLLLWGAQWQDCCCFCGWVVLVEDCCCLQADYCCQGERPQCCCWYQLWQTLCIGL